MASKKRSLRGGRGGDELRHRLPPDVVMQTVTTPFSELIDWSHEFLGIPAVQRKRAGEGVKVAILDTGCDLDHQDLAGQILAAKDFTGSPIGPRDKQRHGSWCTGFIVANADDVGVRGVAFKAKALVGKVLNDQGYGSDKSILAGLRWAAEQGANIISMSLGGPAMGQALHTELIRIAAAGIIVVAAAGNDSGPVNYPAAWPETIGVAACDQNGRLTRFSSRGPRVDIMAPGVDMISTGPNNTYIKMSGTSMATPEVAGVCALAWPLNGIEHARKRLKLSAKQTQDGYGLLNPPKLIDDEPPPIPVPGDGYEGPAKVTLRGVELLIYAKS